MGTTMQRWIASALFCLLLSACVTAEEIAAADNRECIELGFEPGTEGYGNCRLKLREIRALEHQALAVQNAYGSNTWLGRPYWW